MHHGTFANKEAMKEFIDKTRPNLQASIETRR